jgi:hypothetical protein
MKQDAVERFENGLAAAADWMRELYEWKDSISSQMSEAAYDFVLHYLPGPHEVAAPERLTLASSMWGSVATVDAVPEMRTGGDVTGDPRWIDWKLVPLVALSLQISGMLDRPFKRSGENAGYLDGGFGPCRVACPKHWRQS